MKRGIYGKLVSYNITNTLDNSFNRSDNIAFLVYTQKQTMKGVLIYV